jgi:hypothetical protein
LILFLLIFAATVVTAVFLIRLFLPSVEAWVTSQTTGIFTPGVTILEFAGATACLLLAVLVMSKIERRSFSSYGLPWRTVFRQKFWFGCAVGFGGVLLQIILIAACGGYSPGGLALAGASVLKFGLLWAVAHLLAAIYEEFSFRGYLQATLATGIGFWPAAVVLSIIFGAIHLRNPGVTWPGVVMEFCFAILGAFTLRLTGDLWFIIGFHAAWDWAHIFLFSVPIAGLRSNQQLLHSSLHGPEWLTGGSWGPDGSVFCFVVVLLIGVLVYRVFSRGKANPT